jgi:hypothetical protein
MRVVCHECGAEQETARRCRKCAAEIADAHDATTPVHPVGPSPQAQDMRPVWRYNEASIKAAFGDDQERIASFKRAMDPSRAETSAFQPEQQRRRQTRPAPLPVWALPGGNRSNDGYVDQLARRGVRTGKGCVGWILMIIVGMMMLGLVLDGLGVT